MEVTQQILDQLVKMNERLDGIDNRLDGMDKRFDKIEQRLDSAETIADERHAAIIETLARIDENTDFVARKMKDIIEIEEQHERDINKLIVQKFRMQ